LCCRYLYYTDWGQKASVVRTRLDGSSPTVLKTGLNNPNGIAVVGSKIYVTDSNYRTRTGDRTVIDGSLYSMNLDGTGWTDVLAAATTKLKVSKIMAHWTCPAVHLCHTRYTSADDERNKICTNNQ